MDKNHVTRSIDKVLRYDRVITYIKYTALAQVISKGSYSSREMLSLPAVIVFVNTTKLFSNVQSFLQAVALAKVESGATVLRKGESCCTCYFITCSSSSQ